MWEENRAVRAVSQPVLGLVLGHFRVSVVCGGMGCRPGLVGGAVNTCEGVVRRGVFGVHLLHVNCPSNA